MKRHVLMGMLVFLAAQAGTGRAQEDGAAVRAETKAKLEKNQVKASAWLASLLSDLPFGRLYSIQPNFEPKHVDDHKDYFEGYRINGSVDLGTVEQRRIIYTALIKAVSQGGEVMDCFDPHHALRVVKEGKPYDFVICFGCHSVGGSSGGFTISSSGAEAFDDFLTLYKVPLRPKPELSSKPQP